MALIDNIAKYWKCDENTDNTTVADATGGADANASVHTSTLSTAGKINTAFNFNGINEYVDTNYPVPNIASAKSFSFWVKTTTANSTTIAGCYDGNDYIYIQTNRFANTVEYDIYDGTNSFAVYFTNATLFDGEWHMVTITQGSGAHSSVTMYVDSVSQDITVFSAGTVNGDALDELYFAAKNNQSSAEGFFPGDLDEIGIWDKVLTQGEIDYLYNSRNGFAYPFTFYTLTTSVSPTGAGSVTGGGSYPAGNYAVVKATLNDPYSFTEWTGDLSGSTNPTTILMDDNKSITANFISHATTLGTKELRTDWPCVTGLGADDKHAGRQINLVAERSSLVSAREKVGL